MNLEQKVMNELKAAMKAKDQAALRTLRAIKAAILLAKTDGSRKELDEASELKLVQKLAKQRQESIDIFEKQGRDDLAAGEKEELAVLKKFLPEPMTEEELSAIISEIIQSTGASGMKDMGKVMGMVNQKVAGRANGKMIANIVKSILNA
jgi:uncharacterized protein YqeY